MDRPDLERFYARLEDEHELKERAQTLERKLDVRAETARAPTDIIDVERATRPRGLVVVLIMAELLLTIGQIVFWHRRGSAPPCRECHVKRPTCWVTPTAPGGT